MSADRPTPETDAHFARRGFRTVYTTDEDFAKGLECQRDSWKEIARNNMSTLEDALRQRDEAREDLAKLSDPLAVHINMMRGTIAWTPENLRHLLGDNPKTAEAKLKLAVEALEWANIELGKCTKPNRITDTLAAIKAGKEGAV